MSNPPYGVPGGQGTPWPQYGDNGAGAPMQGMPMQGMPMQGVPMQGMPMQGGPQNFQGGGYGGPVAMPIVKGPSSAPGTILIVLGVLASFVAAPILFFVLWFQGVTDMTEALTQGATFSNGGTVEVSGAGSYMLQISGGEATTCKMIDSGNNTYDMSVFHSNKSIYYIDGLNNGTFTVRCEGIAQNASITGMSVSPNDFTNSIGFAFLWSTVVGVSGVVLLIVGIVLVVRAGSKRKELQQQAMMQAMY